MANPVSFKFEGVKKVLVNIARRKDYLYKHAIQAVTMEAHAIESLSMGNTPVDSGNLRASHKVKVKVGVGGIKATVSVGGSTEPYALAVHEHLSEHSPPSWKAAEKQGNPVKFNANTGPGPKFLENAFRSRMPIEKRIADRISQASGNGSAKRSTKPGSNEWPGLGGTT